MNSRLSRCSPHSTSSQGSVMRSCTTTPINHGLCLTSLATCWGCPSTTRMVCPTRTCAITSRSSKKGGTYDVNEHELEAVLTTLDREQQQRAEALKQARAVLLSKQVFGNNVGSMFTARDMIIMAQYIITGETPTEHDSSDEVRCDDQGDTGE